MPDSQVRDIGLMEGSTNREGDGLQSPGPENHGLANFSAMESGREGPSHSKAKFWIGPKADQAL